MFSNYDRFNSRLLYNVLRVSTSVLFIFISTLTQNIACYVYDKLVQTTTIQPETYFIQSEKVLMLQNQLVSNFSYFLYCCI